MKKVKVLFFTSNIINEGDGCAQDQFSVTQEVADLVSTEVVAGNIISQLSEFEFIAGDDERHFYRTSTITDFIIKELKE